jgi:PPM family protein phosphatase
MSKQPRVQFASKTDVGMRRAANQDSLATRLCDAFEEWQSCGHLFVVADGMGGHAVGDLASRITVDTLPHVFFKTSAGDAMDRMSQAVLAANKAINDRGRQNPDFADMGTTCSVLSLSEVGAVIGHVGDSRVYRVRDESVCQLTFDHSLQWEMIRLGRATAENVDLYHPRNIITRCLGPDPNVKVELEGPFSVHAGDRFVLCSDGLTNHVSDNEIGSIVMSLPPSEASKLLINLTNCRGGTDNSTVIVVEVDEYPELTAAPVDDDDDVSPQPDPDTRADAPLVSHLSGRLMLVLAGLLLVVAAVFSARQHWTVAVSAGVVGLLTGLAALVFGARKGDLANHGFPESEGTDESAADSTNFTKSPYRIVGTDSADRVLNLLAEIQSELVQAARDSGWDVDFDELTALSRQAASADQSGKPEGAIRFRAKAIDLLMKELYHRSRDSRTA